MGLLFFASPSFAADEKQVMEYDVYAGGFHVVSADLTVDLTNKTNYMLRLAAYTHGVLARLAPWSGSFQSEGWYDQAKSFPQPRIHYSETNWKKENELTEFLYNRDGTFKEYRLTNNKEKGPQERPAELTQNTTDVLSATLKVMNRIAAGGACEGSDDIFDGKRRFKLIYANSRDVTLEKTRHNVYSGPATECNIEVKPVAGKWREKPRGWLSIQEQGRQKGTMPTIWFAQMAEGEPAVPVRIRVKTDYGTLFMHLTGYTGAGETLKLGGK